jgi:hypothetical protein
MSTVFKIGSKGVEVAILQDALNKSMQMTPPLVCDGDFGAITDKAVRDYQASNGLSVDGIVGPKTLNKSIGNPPECKTYRSVNECLLYRSTALKLTASHYEYQAVSDNSTNRLVHGDWNDLIRVEVAHKILNEEWTENPYVALQASLYMKYAASTNATIDVKAAGNLAAHVFPFRQRNSLSLSLALQPFASSTVSFTQGPTLDDILYNKIGVNAFFFLTIGPQIMQPR